MEHLSCDEAVHESNLLTRLSVGVSDKPSEPSHTARTVTSASNRAVTVYIRDGTGHVYTGQAGRHAREAERDTAGRLPSTVPKN